MITVTGATLQRDKVFVGVLICAITGMFPQKLSSEPRKILTGDGQIGSE
jgi:hypothetical protein